MKTGQQATALLLAACCSLAAVATLAPSRAHAQSSQLAEARAASGQRSIGGTASRQQLVNYGHLSHNSKTMARSLGASGARSLSSKRRRLRSGARGMGTSWSRRSLLARDQLGASKARALSGARTFHRQRRAAERAPSGARAASGQWRPPRPGQDRCPCPNGGGGGGEQNQHDWSKELGEGQRQSVALAARKAEGSAKASEVKKRERPQWAGPNQEAQLGMDGLDKVIPVMGGQQAREANPFESLTVGGGKSSASSGGGGGGGGEDDGPEQEADSSPSDAQWQGGEGPSEGRTGAIGDALLSKLGTKAEAKEELLEGLGAKKAEKAELLKEVFEKKLQAKQQFLHHLEPTSSTSTTSTTPAPTTAYPSQPESNYTTRAAQYSGAAAGSTTQAAQYSGAKQSKYAKYPLYESPLVEALPARCRVRVRTLADHMQEVLHAVERLGQKALPDGATDYPKRDELSRKLAKIRTAAEESLMAANLAKLSLLNRVARQAGIEVLKLASTREAVRLEPDLRRLGASLRRAYGFYRKYCKGVVQEPSTGRKLATA